VGSDGELRPFLQQRVAAATQEVARLDADYLLADNEDLLVAGIVSKFMPDPVLARWRFARVTDSA
jgi:hypothetical protein